MPDGMHLVVLDSQGAVDVYDLSDPILYDDSEWLPEEDCLLNDYSYEEGGFGPGERCRTHSTRGIKRLSRRNAGVRHEYQRQCTPGWLHPCCL